MKRRYRTEGQIIMAIDWATKKAREHNEELGKIRQRIKSIQRREENPDDRGDVLKLLIERDERINAASMRVARRLQRLKQKLAEFRTPLMPAFGTDYSIPA